MHKQTPTQTKTSAECLTRSILASPDEDTHVLYVSIRATNVDKGIC